MRALVTGGSGFIGRARLARSAHVVRIAHCGQPGTVTPVGFETVLVGDVDSRTDWSAALAGIEAVVHLAALAHQPKGAVDEERFLEVNGHGTGQLARAAAAAGVRRFLLLSSIKVNGEGIAGRAYTRSDPPPIRATPTRARNPSRRHC